LRIASKDQNFNVFPIIDQALIGYLESYLALRTIDSLQPKIPKKNAPKI
jgi:hypothetical protein